MIRGQSKAHHDAAWTGRTRAGSSRLVEAASSFVASQGDWTVFVTPTFARERTDGDARERLRRFLRALARKVANGHVRYVAAEGRHASGALHFHLLLELPATVQMNHIALAWSDASGGGTCRPEPIRSIEAVSEYAMRHSDWSPPEIACPRWPGCRRAPGEGCRESVR